MLECYLVKFVSLEVVLGWFGVVNVSVGVIPRTLNESICSESLNPLEASNTTRTKKIADFMTSNKNAKSDHAL